MCVTSFMVDTLTHEGQHMASGQNEASEGPLILGFELAVWTLSMPANEIVIQPYSGVQNMRDVIYG